MRVGDMVCDKLRAYIVRTRSDLQCGDAFPASPEGLFRVQCKPRHGRRHGALYPNESEA